MKIAEFANRVDLDEAAQNDKAWTKHVLKFCRLKFCHLLFGTYRVKDVTVITLNILVFTCLSKQCRCRADKMGVDFRGCFGRGKLCLITE